MAILFFDLDGTLTESHPGIFNSIRHSLIEQKLPLPTDEQLRLFIGPPLLDSYIHILGQTPTKAAKSVKLYRDYFETKGLYENNLYPEIPQLLANLQAAGDTLYLVTSKPEPFARKIIKFFGIDIFLTDIFGASMDETRSQKADIINYAITTIKPNLPTDITMVGDRKDDILGAKAYGIHSIGVLYGYGSKEELLEAGADVLATEPKNIYTTIHPTASNA